MLKYLILTLTLTLAVTKSSPFYWRVGYIAENSLLDRRCVLLGLGLGLGLGLELGLGVGLGFRVGVMIDCLVEVNKHFFNKHLDFFVLCPDLEIEG
eukprot:1393642-Amorphochlora_amoeboformis.AAC.1